MDVEFDAIDQEKIEKGAWSPVDDETDIRVRRIGYGPYRNLINTLREQAIEELGLGETEELPEERTKVILATAVAEEILTDWRGMKAGGKEFEYSKERALELLLDPRHEAFLGQILLKAGNSEIFRVGRNHEMGKS